MDTKDLRAWWVERYGRSHEHAVEHPEELTEYGRLVHIEMPALIERLDRAEQRAAAPVGTVLAR